MVRQLRRSPRRGSRGASMIEVLVTMFIMAMGLLGLSGLQARLHSSEVEAYQRTQALLLLNDLKGRIEANRLQLGLYADGAPLAAPVGTAMNCPVTSPSSTPVAKDISDWCNSLQGAAETKNAGANRLGAMIGSRGCVEDLGTGASGDRSVRITVAWQGLTPIAAPPEACGAGAYDGTAGSSCQGDRCRRAVSTVVRVARLAS